MGAACAFRHDRTADPCAEVCRFFLRGECAHGARCRYVHSRPNKPQRAAQERPPQRLVPRPDVGGGGGSGVGGMGELAAALPRAGDGGGGAAGWKEGGSGGGAQGPSSGGAEGAGAEGAGADGAGAEDAGAEGSRSEEGSLASASALSDVRPLCSLFAKTGACSRGEACPFVHGDVCARCGLPCLHPEDAQQRVAHEAECAAREERWRAVRASADVECSICLERVLGTASGGLDGEEDDGVGPAVAPKFGVMEACDHPFCLSCIRAWRGGDAVKGQARTCPMCRVRSHYVVPSATWPRSAEEKDKVITDWRARLAAIDCMHFRSGEGTCPFGSSCFYRHAYKDGTLQDRSKTVRFVTAGDAQSSGHVVAAPRLSEYLDGAI